MFGRRSYTWARDEIARLDPTVDYDRITHLVSEARFGWPPIAGAFYSITFARQVGVPSIAKILYRGGGGAAMADVRKRNDDTLVIFGEIFSNGASTERGIATIERLQEIHGLFPITQDDYRYTLCSIIDEPERSADVIGVRTMSWAEDEARFRFWISVGERMGITELPTSYHAALDYSADYERTHWAPTKEGAAVARSVIEDYIARYLPAPLRPLGFRGFCALLGPELCEIHGFKQPGRLLRAVVIGGLATYLRGRRVLPDPPVRPVAQSFGQAYGKCPHLADVGYQPPAKKQATGGVNGAQTSSSVPAR